MKAEMKLIVVARTRLPVHCSNADLMVRLPSSHCCGKRRTALVSNRPVNTIFASVLIRRADSGYRCSPLKINAAAIGTDIWDGIGEITFEWRQEAPISAFWGRGTFAARHHAASRIGRYQDRPRHLDNFRLAIFIRIAQMTFYSKCVKSANILVTPRPSMMEN